MTIMVTSEYAIRKVEDGAKANANDILVEMLVAATPDSPLHGSNSCAVFQVLVPDTSSFPVKWEPWNGVRLPEDVEQLIEANIRETLEIGINQVHSILERRGNKDFTLKVGRISMPRAGGCYIPKYVELNENIRIVVCGITTVVRGNPVSAVESHRLWKSNWLQLRSLEHNRKDQVALEDQSRADLCLEEVVSHYIEFSYERGEEGSWQPMKDEEVLDLLPSLRDPKIIGERFVKATFGVALDVPSFPEPVIPNSAYLVVSNVNFNFDI